MLMFSNYDSVLYSSLKLNYFCKVGWEPEWIETMWSIVRVEYQHSYKGQYDKESLVPADNSRPTTPVRISITLTISNTLMMYTIRRCQRTCSTAWTSLLTWMRMKTRMSLTSTLLMMHSNVMIWSSGRSQSPQYISHFRTWRWITWPFLVSMVPICFAYELWFNKFY